MTAEAPNKEVVPSIVDQGMRSLTVEIRSQRALALERPRDERRVIEAALAELNAFPEFARAAYYSIPYKDYETGETKAVEGPSVKASRAMARRWGNCATASRILDESDDRYQVEGIFVDFETNTIFRRTVSVSKSYISRKTKVKTMLRDDRLTLALQAGMSKAERNASLAGLSVPFVETYYAEARRVAASGKTAGSKKVQPIKERWDWLFAQVLKVGVTKDKFKEHIDDHCGENAEDEQRLAYAIGVYNSIKDGQVNIDEVFGGSKPSAEAKPGQTNLKDALRGRGKES